MGPDPSLIEQSGYIPTASEFGTFITEIAKDDLDLAVCALFLQMEKDHSPLQTSPKLLQASALILNFDQGVSSKGNATNKRMLSKIRASYESLLNSAEEEFDQVREKVSKDISSTEARRKAATTRIAKWIKKKRKEVRATEQLHQLELKRIQDEAKEELSEDIAVFREAVEKQTSLQAPVKYWQYKRANHCAATYIVGTIFLLYSALLFNAVHVVFAQLDYSLEQYMTLPSDLGFEGIAVIVVIIAIALIFSRILYRLFASQLHLWNDASERVTMIQTYLALSVKGHAKEQHMEALIGRLFRPASDGVVKDDLGSIHGLDAAINRMQR